MRRLPAGVVLLVAFVLTCPNPGTAGAADDALLRLLIKKGLVTREEYEALKKEMEPTAPPINPESVAAPPRRGSPRRGSSSGTYIRAAEVAIAARLLEWLEGSVVLKSEYVGTETTDQGQPADAAPFVDEATLTLGSPAFSLYGAIGKRRQPFGAFSGDERWASDPMSKDAYEINQPGLTVGFVRKLHRGSLAASFTLFERGDISARLIGEYRLSDIRRGGAARATAAPDQNELFGKLSVVYK